MTEIQERNRRPGSIPAAGPATDANVLSGGWTKSPPLRRETPSVLPVATIEIPSTSKASAGPWQQVASAASRSRSGRPAAAEGLRRARAVDGFLLGAGTVLTVPSRRWAAAEAGADFAVAPRPERGGRRSLPRPRPTVLPRRRHAVRDRPRAPARVEDAQGLSGRGARRAGIPPRRLRRLSRTSGSSRQEASMQARSAATSPSRSVVACAGSWLVRRDLLTEGGLAEIERLAREA